MGSPEPRLARLDARRALILLVSVAVFALGVWQIALQASGGGGRVYANPVCAPETADWCGVRSDVFPLLAGARLTVQRESPYGPAIVAETARFAPPDVAAVHRVYYPAAATLLVAPLAVLPYEWGGALFTWITTIVFVACLGMLLRYSSRGRCPWLLALGGAALLTAAFPAWRSAAYLQQPALLVAALQAGLCVALLRGRWTLAGVLTALTLIKPQFTGIPALVALVALGVADRTRRGLIAFATTVAGLLAVSFALVPSWLGDFRANLEAYGDGDPLQSVLARMGLSVPLILVLGAGVMALLIAGVVRDRAAPDRTVTVMAYLGAASLALLVAPRIDPLVGAYDHMLLLLPVGVLAGRAFRGGARAVALGAVAVAVPVFAILARDWLGYRQWFLDAADRAFAWIAVPIPDGFLYGNQVADFYLQTFALLAVVALSLWVARPPLGTGARRLTRAIAAR